MKLLILSCEDRGQGLYVLSLQYGDSQFSEEVRVVEGVVTYLEFGEPLLEILHKDVGVGRHMNQLMFKIHRQEAVAFPVEVGES